MDNVSETKKNESQNYTSIGMILCELQQILNRLINYDFGFIFATPGELMCVLLLLKVLLHHLLSDNDPPLSHPLCLIG